MIRLPVVEVGYESVAEDTLADGEKKAVAVAEVELADVEAAHQRRTSWSSMQPKLLRRTRWPTERKKQWQ